MTTTEEPIKEERQEELCACGKPLHYTNPSTHLMMERFGAEMRVTVGGRTWMVPRHYIALHGLKADNIPNLGFREALP